MNDAPKLALVKTIYDSNSRDIAATLQKHVDGLKKKDPVLGDVTAIVVVHLRQEQQPGSEKGDTAVTDEKISVFGMGATDYWHSLGLLQGAVAHLTKMIKS